MSAMSQESVVAEPRSVRVLLVDDDADIRGLCARALRRAAFEVDEAEDGERGWTALLSGNHRLVIANHLMPKTSGLALARRMRVAGMDQPVILLTTSAYVDFRPKDPWQRIDEVLVKPFTSCELMNRVAWVLRPEARNPFAPELREERQSFV
jgi:DNA-binding response OmpR family regulator